MSDMESIRVDLSEAVGVETLVASTMTEVGEHASTAFGAVVKIIDIRTHDALADPKQAEVPSYAERAEIEARQAYYKANNSGTNADRAHGIIARTFEGSDDPSAREAGALAADQKETVKDTASYALTAWEMLHETTGETATAARLEEIKSWLVRCADRAGGGVITVMHIKNSLNEYLGKQGLPPID